jgi:hypothetical protein
MTPRPLAAYAVDQVVTVLIENVRHPLHHVVLLEALEAHLFDRGHGRPSDRVEDRSSIAACAESSSMMRSTIMRFSTNARGPASSKRLNSFSTDL